MKTLLRATNWVGDVVLSLPALRALRASFPRERIAVLARPWVADLYRLRPEVDEVLVEEPSGAHAGRAGRERLVAELKERRFDRAVLLPSSFGTAWVAFRARIPERIGWRGELRAPLLTRSLSPRERPAGEHEVWKHLRIVAAAGARFPERPDTSWPAERREREEARRLLAGAGVAEGEPFVAAHIASFAHAAKRWDHGRFAELFTRIASRGARIVLLGSAGETAQNAAVATKVPEGRAVDLSGKTTLPQALGILSLARAFAGNDSGLAHLAAAAGTPTVVVFGPTDPDATRPWDGAPPAGAPPRVVIVRHAVLCAPCRFRVCPIDHRCMREVTADAVEEAVARFL